MEPAPSRSLRILVVDDDPADTLLICEALTEGCGHVVTTAGDGAEALAHLRQMSLPDLVLLDLNMPRMNGHEVLAEIKTDEALRHIPVIIFSSSSSPEDVLSSYRLHGSAFVTKPVDLDQFVATIQHIGRFYDEVALLPQP